MGTVGGLFACPPEQAQQDQGSCQVKNEAVKATQHAQASAPEVGDEGVAFLRVTLRFLPVGGGDFWKPGIGVRPVGHALEHGGQTEIFIFHGIAKAVAGGVEVGKQTFYIVFRWITISRILDVGKNGFQVGVQVGVGIG